MSKTVKYIIVTAMCVMSFALTGCSQRQDDFIDFETIDLSEPGEPKIAEDVVLTTEFPEYEGNVDEIVLMITNNSDKEFSFGREFVLQKLDEGEWKYIQVFGIFTMLSFAYRPTDSGPFTIKLKDHIDQPLLPGCYRIGIGEVNLLDFSFPGEMAFAEFTIK